MLVFNFFTYLMLIFFGIGAVATEVSANEIAPQFSTVDTCDTIGRYTEALSFLDAAIAKDPCNVRLYKLRLHIYYATKNFSGALCDLDTLVTLCPHSANAYVDRAIVQSGLGRHCAALSDIEQALAIKPDSRYAQAVRNQLLHNALKQ